MVEPRPPLVRKRFARTVLDLALLVAIVVVARALFVPALHAAHVRAEVRAVADEARELHRAFQLYFEHNGAYPDAYAEPGFDPVSLDPLRRRGYYKGFVTAKLLDGEIDAYDSSDLGGTGPEFWVEMTLARDSGIRFVVANSDDAPLGGGQWLDGVFIYRDGSLDSI